MKVIHIKARVRERLDTQSKEEEGMRPQKQGYWRDGRQAFSVSNLAGKSIDSCLEQVWYMCPPLSPLGRHSRHNGLAWDHGTDLDTAIQAKTTT